MFYHQMIKPLLTFPPFQDDGPGPSSQVVPTNETENPPQAVLDVAVKLVNAQRGSILEELGLACDAVEIILTIVETVADVSPFTLLPGT
jgi:hypothetical protein